MPRLKGISIENYRSIGESPVEISFPENTPVILIGENNSGKSNIARALELMFGEFHPKYKKLEDFDHFDRNPQNKVIIKADVQGFQNRMGKAGEFTCGGFYFDSVKNKETSFDAIQFEDGYHNRYVSAQLRDELLCVIVNSEQNLSFQLSYATKYTLLSKVTKAFHDKLVEDERKVDSLKELFESTKEIFLSVPEFKGFTEKMSDISGEMLSNMSHALQFDFSAYDPSNYFKTLRVQPSEDEEVRAIEELGTGQQQILALSFAHAYAKCFLGQGLIFVVDEPEAHLHPLAQKWLAKQMFKMATDGLQLVITTHSPHFISLDYLDGIYLVRKEDQTFVKHLTRESLTNFCLAKGAYRATEESIVPYYTAHSTPHILSGFFANKIVLVEGRTEEMALPIYLNAVGLDTLRSGIGVIGVGGKGNLAKWWRLFSAYEIPTFVCFDNDVRDDGNAAKRKDALRAIGIPENQFDDLLGLEDWNISDGFCVFGKDFEQSMRNAFASYAQFEGEETQRLGDSKPIIARTVAQRIVTTARGSDTGWEKLELLRNRINALDR